MRQVSTLVEDSAYSSEMDISAEERNAHSFLDCQLTKCDNEPVPLLLVRFGSPAELSVSHSTIREKKADQ